MPKGVKFEICIQPDSKGRMLIALPDNKIAALSERQWPRLHRLLQELYGAAQRAESLRPNTGAWVIRGDDHV